MKQKGTNVFTYGTLMKPSFTFQFCKREYQHCKATLNGYERKHVKGAHYPGIRPKKGASVEGVLFLDIQPDDLQKLHSYEGVEDGLYSP